MKYKNIIIEYKNIIIEKIHFTTKILLLKKYILQQKILLLNINISNI